MAAIVSNSIVVESCVKGGSIELFLPIFTAWPPRSTRGADISCDIIFSSSIQKWRMTQKNLQENVTYIIFHYQQSVSQFTYTKQLYVCFTLSSSLYYNRIDYFFLKVESTPAGRMCTICCSASVPLHINKSHEKYFVVFCLKSLKFQNFLSNLMNTHTRLLLS